MSAEIARRRIESFSRRFGESALILAYHAAFPIALTPDLIYRLWANFKEDVNGNRLKIPWIAVANVLLSTLVDEVGYELFEMDEAVRSELLKRLKDDSRFGQQRIKELSYFLLAYIEEKLTSYDSYEREFAQAQQWTALAFVEPNKGARELALKLKEAYNEQNQDKYELIRVASFIETLAEPLKDYQPLLTYARGMVNWVLDNNELAISEFKKLPRIKKRSQVEKLIKKQSQEELIFSIPERKKSVPQKPKFDDSTLKELYINKVYGASILQELDKLKGQQNEILGNHELQECLEKLERAANETVELESSPVKIAIMGEFSSGKTRLIESLIGYGGILPVSNTPTTGNITAIHLIPQDGFKTTEFEKFEVEYLSKEEVQKCLEFMFGEARRLAGTSSSELPNFPTVDSIEKLSETNLNDWEKLCKEAGNKIEHMPDLDNLLTELVTLIDTYRSYQGHLYSDESPENNKIFKIDRDTACEGLKLNNESTANNKVTFNPEKLSLDSLQSSFSLIRRVNIHVKISSEIWNLGTTQYSAKFILLEFPGSRASKSKVRDTFVSEQKLKEVQTNLFLLNGSSNPGSDDANKILTMVRKIHGENLKDRILVGVSQFNQLLEKTSSEKAELDKLIDDSTSLTEAKVLEEFSILRAFIDDAKQLGSEENIVFLDQNMALKHLQDNSPDTVQVGSENFLADELDNPNVINLSVQMSQKWGSLSRRILDKDSGSSLGKQLGYFAYDGGIGKLRHLLLEHVAAHALKQLHEASSSAASSLKQQQQQLREILLELGILKEESPALKKLRSHLEKMYSTYNRFKDNELGKEPLKNKEGVAVNDVVKDRVTYEILDWKQWNLLFARAQNGRIIISSRNNNEEERFSRRKRSADKIPTQSDDFYPEFDNTLHKLQKFADGCIKKAVENLLGELSENRLSEEIAHLKEILPEEDEEMGTEIEGKLGDEEAELFYVLCQAYDPKKWQEFVIEVAFKDKELIETATAFPLARKDEKHPHGQIFEWAPEYSRINPKTDNHLLTVIQLRDEITSSISLHLEDYVSQINKRVEGAIVNILNDFLPDLYEILKADALLRYITKDKQEVDEDDNSILNILSKIVFIPSPK